MARQIINIGNDPNDGSGDTIRDSFNKVNSNFAEVYANIELLNDGNVVTDIKGNVFADDSTLLVDGINSSINLDGTVKGDIIPDTDVAYDIGSVSNRFRDLYLSGSTIDLGGTTLSVVGGELQLGGVKIPTQAEVTASIAGAIAAPTGDLTGSVFADDSTLLVDSVAGKIVGTVDTFQANITNLSSRPGSGLNIVGQVGDTNGYGISITGGRGLTGNGGAVQINGGPGDNADRGAVNIGQSSGEVRIDSGSSLFLSSVSGDLSIGRVGGATDVYGEVEFNNGTTLFQAGNSVTFNTSVDFNGIVNFDDAIIDWVPIVSNVLVNNGLPILPTQTLDISGSIFADDSTLLVDGVNGKLIGPLLTENISHPSNDGLGIRLNSTDQSTLMVAKQSFDRTFDETFDAGYTLSMLNTPNRVRVTFEANNGLYFRGLMERWSVLYDDIRSDAPSDFEYDYSNIRLSLEPDTYDIVTNVVDVAFVSDNVYDIEIDQDPIVVLADAGAEPGEIGQIALRYDYNNTVGFDVDRNRYGMSVDHEDIDLRAGRDVDLYAVDDFRARAGSAFNLTLVRNDNQDPEQGININLESYDAGNFIGKIWAFQFDGNLRLPNGGDIVDSNGNSVLKNLDGDLTGSVFADDSTLLVDGVNGRIVGAIDTAAEFVGDGFININNDAYGSGQYAGFTTDKQIFNIQAASRVGGGDNGGSVIILGGNAQNSGNNGGVLIATGAGGTAGTADIDIRADGDVALYSQNGAITFEGTMDFINASSIQNFAPGNVYANSGQFLYVTSKHSGGSATNVAFTYDASNNRPSQTFYGKTEFGGLAPIVDFDDVTVENWSDPNVVNTHGGGAIIVVAGQTATMDDLTVRITENTPGEIDVEFNYNPSSGTVAVSANGDVANRFNGTTNFTAGNTTWTTMNILTIVGDKGEFTIADHSFHKIYRVTTFARALPGGVDAGDAYCVIERLK